MRTCIDTVRLERKWCVEKINLKLRKDVIMFIYEKLYGVLVFVVFVYDVVY